MNAWWERLRWRVALVAGALLLLQVIVNHEEAWAALGVLHFPYYFLDTKAVLSAGQAWHAGLDVYQEPNPFDPLGRPHVYGPWWLVTGPLGLTTADALWIGPLLGLAFLLVAAAVLAPRRPAATGVALLLLVCPPILMALERGNNDLVVFILLAAAGALLTRARGLAALGTALVILAAALKIYPLAALTVLGVRHAPRRSVLVWVGVAFGVCGVIFLLWRNDFESAMHIAPAPRTIHTFGVKLLVWMWEWPDRTVALVWQGILTGTFGTVAVLWLRRHARILWAAVPPTGVAAAWFVAGASAWCFCYLVNSNYPYRAVLWLLPARLWLDQAGGPAPQPAGTARALLGAFVVVGWLHPLKTWSAVHLPRWRPADLCLASVLSLEQCLLAAATAALLISLTGWLWRRFRSAEVVQAGPGPTLQD